MNPKNRTSRLLWTVVVGVLLTGSVAFAQNNTSQKGTVFLPQPASDVVGLTIDGPQDASDNIPWCDPVLFEKPIDGSKIPPPDDSEFPPKPSCKIKTVGRVLSEGEVVARRTEMLRRYPQLKDIEQVRD